MANFEAVKIGGWDFEDPITHDEISTLQQHILKSPNFSEGGTYAPTNAVIVGGAGMVLNALQFTSSANNTITGTLDASTGNGQIVESLQVVTAANSVLYANKSRRVRANYSSNGTILLSPTNAGGSQAPKDGSIIEVLNVSAAAAVTVRDFQTSTDLIEIPATVQGYAKYWAEFIWLGTQWELHRYQVE